MGLFKKQSTWIGFNALKGHNDPPQILKFVEQYIDYDKIWEKELENKLGDFYEAMGWEKPNSNLQKASQFFGF